MEPNPKRFPGTQVQGVFPNFPCGIHIQSTLSDLEAPRDFMLYGNLHGEEVVLATIPGYHLLEIQVEWPVCTQEYWTPMCWEIGIPGKGWTYERHFTFTFLAQHWHCWHWHLTYLIVMSSHVLGNWNSNKAVATLEMCVNWVPAILVVRNPVEESTLCFAKLSLQRKSILSSCSRRCCRRSFYLISKPKDVLLWEMFGAMSVGLWRPWTWNRPSQCQPRTEYTRTNKLCTQCNNVRYTDLTSHIVSQKHRLFHRVNLQAHL